MFHKGILSISFEIWVNGSTSETRTGGGKSQIFRQLTGRLAWKSPRRATLLLKAVINLKRR
jgi:hypothetical protein